MKLVKPSHEIIEQEPGIEGIYKQIELAARNCYKSEPVEGVTSKDFVDRMVKRGHLSTLEHGTVYLKYDDSPITGRDELGDYSYKNPNPLKWLSYDSYSKVNVVDNIWYVTTNYRVLSSMSKYMYENTIKCLCEPTEFHEKRITVKFTSNIHFYKDITRHRRMSFAIESTRYCNYSKDKFGNELTFIMPAWVDESKLPKGTIINHDDMGDLIGEHYFHLTGKETSYFKPWIVTSEMNFVAALQVSEQLYLELINQGWQAQQAAEVLPQATKADIIMTGFVSDWKHIFNLRTSIIAATGKPHPEVSRLMDPLYKEFKERKLI